MQVAADVPGHGKILTRNCCSGPQVSGTAKIGIGGGGDTGFVADAPRVLELLLALLLQLLLPSESTTCYSSVLPRTTASTILVLTLEL